MASVAVELKLLGGFELRQAGGRVIDPSGQKDRALLAFLALPSLTSHPREKLASLLWSDRGDQQARDSLKHSLTRLRQSLQPLTPVIADRQSVKLDPAGMTIDVATFERLVSNGTVESLVQAGTIYRGDLLENFNIKSAPFAEWLLIERQRLRHLFEAALTRLLSESLAAKSFDSTAAAARRLLSLDPLHEPATRALMHIHAGRGQVAQALKLYDTLRGRLNNELGVGPAPETTRLYETIKQQRSVSAAANPLLAEPLHSTTVPTIPLPDKPSIAVLPFENLSGDAGQQYFSDGITEDITTELSRFRTLFVIARQSSFAFKSRSIKVQEIARELGVAFIVEGSVRRAADRVRISAQLIDAATGNHLWAEKYDREILDIFAVQDEVARSVAAAVSGRVDVAGRDRVERSCRLFAGSTIDA